MRRVVRHGAAVLFLSMWVAVGADGAGGRSTSWSSQSAPAVTYIYYAPAYSIPYPVVPMPCQPIAPTPPMPYAGTVVPVPKTPETKEPPVKDPVRSKAPSVTESRSMGGGYAAS